MKRLFLLILSSLLFINSNAQNGRWMYLSKSNDGVTYMVDTLTADTKSLTDFDSHANAIMIWVKTIQHKSGKKGSITESSISRCVIDTTNNQMETKSLIVYKNSAIAYNNNFDYEDWRDIIPDSMGEVLLGYCKALYDQAAMDKLVAKAQYHDLPIPPRKKKKINQ